MNLIKATFAIACLITCCLGPYPGQQQTQPSNYAFIK